MKLSPCSSVHTGLPQAKPVYGGWLCLAPEGTDFDNPMQRSRVSPGRGGDNDDTGSATLQSFLDYFFIYFNLLVVFFVVAEMAASLLCPVRRRQPELRPGRTGEGAHATTTTTTTTQTATQTRRELLAAIFRPDVCVWNRSRRFGLSLSSNTHTHTHTTAPRSLTHSNTLRVIPSNPPPAATAAPLSDTKRHF